MKRILVLPGSLRTNSSSNLIIRSIVSMATPDVSWEIFDGLGMLPQFNDPEEEPSPVTAFKRKLAEADAVLICTPEYAFGIPGSLKNAIDWTVGSGELVEKPVGLITASSQGEKGHAAMLLVLTAVSARVAPAATLLISFVRSKIDERGNIKDPALLVKISEVVAALGV